MVTTAPNKPWSALLICPDQELGEEVRAILGNSGQLVTVTEVKEYPSQTAITRIVADAKPTICFVDVASNAQTALPLIRSISRTDPGLSLVSLHRTNDPEIVLQCLRHGAREFLFRPITLEQLEGALDRLARIRAQGVALPRRPLGKVYAFMPGKGACGSTTVACNFAFHLRRLIRQKVLLADLDPLTGTIAFLLKLQSRYSFVDALGNSSRMDDDLWKGLVNPCHGMDVLLAPEDPVEIPFDGVDFTAIMDYWRENYEATVIDSGGLYQEWSASLANLADEVMIVTTNELPALHATQKAMTHLEAAGVDGGKIHLIVNRYNTDIGLDQIGIEKALQHSVAHKLPSDYPGVQKALMEGKPIPSNTKVGTAIMRMAEQMVGIEPKPRKESFLAGLFSLFARAAPEGR